MKLVILDPHRLIYSFGRAWPIHKWIVELLRQNDSYIMLSTLSHLPLLIHFAYTVRISPGSLLSRLVYTAEECNTRMDYIIYPFGMPKGSQEVRAKKILSQIKVPKILHMQDFWVKTKETAAFIESCTVDYVIGYSRHDIESAFFREQYPELINRVIASPFGFCEETYFPVYDVEEQSKVVLCLGAIEERDFILDSGYKEQIPEYYDRFVCDKSFTSMHPLRSLVDNSDLLKPWTRNHFNHKGQAYEYIKDINLELASHRLFMNDISLLNFPPAKTYEGCASGSVMVALDHPCLHNLGFINHENCILFNDLNEKSIEDALESYHSLTLDRKKAIRTNSLALIAQYSHVNVALRLRQDINKRLCS